VKGQGKLNTHIIFKSVLMLCTKNYQKLVHACQNYSLPKSAHFLRQCSLYLIYQMAPFSVTLSDPLIQMSSLCHYFTLNISEAVRDTVKATVE